jgi:hypothetical protein
MKKLIPLLIILVLAFCEQSKAQSNLNIQGAYSLIKQTGNDGTKDTLMKKEQFKIYTDRYMMYASPRPTDSLAVYGIGTYNITNGKVVENVFYSTSAGDQKDTFEVNITKSPTGYTQVIQFNDSNQKFILTEEYKSVGKKVVTPLDGAWKQMKTMYIPKSGKTITDENPKQFKIYQSGYFIWADTYQDVATNQPLSQFGYGTFQMNGRNKSKEINSNSTFVTALVGKPVDLQLEFTGKDSYTQTILYPNGDRSVEVYQRLK